MLRASHVLTLVTLLAPLTALAAGVGARSKATSKMCEQQTAAVEQSLLNAPKHRPYWPKVTPTAAYYRTGQRGVLLEIHRSGKARLDGVDLNGSSTKQRVTDLRGRLAHSRATNVHIWVDKKHPMKLLLPYADAVPTRMGVALVTTTTKKVGVRGSKPWVNDWVNAMRNTRDADKRQKKLLDGIVRAAQDCPTLAESVRRVSQLPANQQWPELVNVVPKGLRTCACKGVDVDAIDSGAKVAANNFGHPHGTQGISVRKNGLDRPRAQRGTVEKFLASGLGLLTVLSGRGGTGTLGSLNSLGGLSGIGSVTVKATATGGLSRARITKLSVSEGLDASVVRRALRRFTPMARFCRDTSGTQLAAKTTISFSIDDRGKVTSASHVDADKLISIGACVARRIQRVRFPQPTQAPVDVTYEIVFSRP